MTDATLNAQSRPAPAAGRRTALVAGVAELALVVLLAVLLARLIWFIAFGSSASDLSVAGAGARPADRLAPPADLSRLIEHELFADRRAEPVAAAEARAEIAPETQLNLELKSTRASADPALGSAIIQLPDGGERAFRIGREIVDGVVLEEVHVGYVVLDRRGVRETLFMPGRDRETAARAPQRRAAPASLSFYGLFTLRAERRGGEVVGYAIAGAPERLLDQLGLEPGDVITAMDGRELASIGDADALFAQFQDQDSVTLSVLRGDTPVSVRVDIP